ncbi:zinc finger, C2H2 type [Oesophagostomum dentatum]|uniref:Zinc finger, C2H2 type n=1 Tax=Oesophagostomum dentatum TaxID=61180 RepID=A0A0B1S4K0_OESDE|nr:zinc finger, C2H2 type [Oesophagostomum dentatum]
MSTLDPSTGFTCVTCHLVFRTPELQRDHYRTDWHRYNLKRQVAELPPVTDEQFREKVIAFRNEREAQKKEQEEVSSLFCAICRKKLKSKNAMADHLASKKHKEMEEREKKGPRQPRKKTSEQPSPQPPKEEEVVENEEDDEDDDSSSGWVTDHGSEDEEDLDFDENEALPITSCLFCPQTKPTKEESLEHMRFHHGFVLPDKKYLVDEDGLLKYLGLKVGAGRCCIFCPDIRSRFATTAACQAHMRDKQHCKVNRDPEGMLEFAEYYDYSPMYEEDNDGVSSDAFYDDGWSLTLPSGAKIGHRSLMLYYRQYLRPTDGNKPDVAKAAIEKAQGLYPALAWTGSTGVIAKQAAKDIKYVERYRRRFDLRVGLKSNKLFKTRGRVGDN